MRSMTAPEAAWVRQHAWTQTMRKTYKSTPAVLVMCPCEYGPCGYCTSGHHAACAHNEPRNAQWTASLSNAPAGWITTADEKVPTLGGTESWQLWEAGVQRRSLLLCPRGPPRRPQRAHRP